MVGYFLSTLDDLMKNNMNFRAKLQMEEYTIIDNIHVHRKRQPGI